MAQKKEKIEFEQPSDILILINRFSVVIFTLIIVIVFVFGYFFILQPKIADIQTIKDETGNSQNKVEENQKLLGMINNLKEEYSDIENNRQRDLRRLQAMIPDSPQIAEFFSVADDLAADNGFLLVSVEVSEDPLTVAEKNQNTDVVVEGLVGLRSMIINMQVVKLPTINEEGFYEMLEPYESFKIYLDKLENNLRLMDIQTIIFGELLDEKPEPLGPEEGEVNITPITFDFSLITYYK